MAVPIAAEAPATHQEKQRKREAEEAHHRTDEYPQEPAEPAGDDHLVDSALQGPEGPVAQRAVSLCALHCPPIAAMMLSMLAKMTPPTIRKSVCRCASGAADIHL